VAIVRDATWLCPGADRVFDPEPEALLEKLWVNGGTARDENHPDNIARCSIR
jgi:hypothetical protein